MWVLELLVVFCWEERSFVLGEKPSTRERNRMTIIEHTVAFLSKES